MKLRSVNLFVLNWNGRDLTLDCLSSLEKITYPNVKVYIIDNGSSDNSVTAIRNQFPDYEIIGLPENYGFARGNNAGFELVKQKADYTIFLNNDTIVDPNFVEPLINAMESNSTVKQSTPKIFYADNLDYIWFGGGKVSLWAGWIRHLGIRQKDSMQFSFNRNVDYATGCCVCMRTVDFESIGMFDESFLMYGEDVDLSLRFRKQGGQILFVPESKIWHKVSSSIGTQFSIRKWKRKNIGKMKLVTKHVHPAQLPIVMPLAILVSILELFITIILGFGRKHS
ncbi:MAG: glycosyltransferase family 2 protein [Candidatus Marinimicrobia bacterium]|nr:glycosyltransferase family 2 protein [Candidatus Neomarinimicrobiota bacterium]